MAPANAEDQDIRSDHGACLHCGLGTNFHCQGCFWLQPDTGAVIKSWYCDKDCQVADWKRHKELCKRARAVKQLYRAGTLLQKIFFAARENTLEHSFNDAKIMDGKIHLYHYEPEYDRNGPPGFPKHIEMNEDDKNAVFSWMYSPQAIIIVYEILPKVLQGLYTKITYRAEKSDHPSARQRIVWHVFRFPIEQAWFNDCCFHEVCVIELKAGGIYVLDITGPQYGWQSPIVLIDRYEEECQAQECFSMSLQEFKNYFCRRFSKNFQMPKHFTLECIPTLHRGLGSFFLEISEGVGGFMSLWESFDTKICAALKADDLGFQDYLRSAVAMISKTWDESNKIHFQSKKLQREKEPAEAASFASAEFLAVAQEHLREKKSQNQ